MNHWRALAVGIIGSTLFVWLTFRQVDLDAVWLQALQANLLLLVASQLPKLVGIIMMSLRSIVLYQPLTRFSFWTAFKSVLVGVSGNAVLPFRLGEVLRVTYLSRESSLPPSACLSVLVLERLMDLVMLVALFGVVMPFTLIDTGGTRTPWVIGCVAVMVLGTAGAAAHSPAMVMAIGTRLSVVLPSKIQGWVLARMGELVSGLAGLRSPWRVLGVMALTLGYLGCSLAACATWFWAFGLELPWYGPFIFLFSTALGSAVPAAPGAVGTYHFFAQSALVTMGVSRVQATSVATVGHALATLPFTLLSLPIWWPILADWYASRRTPSTG
jgi:uncharacterized membrane protein YbhN (UPF0104 family)